MDSANIKNAYDIFGITATKERIFREDPSLDPRINPTPDLLNYLKAFSPDLRYLVTELLETIKFKKFFEKQEKNKPARQVVLDFRLPMNIGGYWDEENQMLALNPYLLMEGRDKIAYVFIHEGGHSGVYDEYKQGIDDESFNDHFARMLTEKFLGINYDSLSSGYNDEVELFREYFGHLSLQEIMELIGKSDMYTLDNLLEVMIIRPLIKSGRVASLGWENIKNEISRKWKVLCELFPRIINNVHSENGKVNPHEEVLISPEEFRLEGMLERASNLLAVNSVLLDKVIADSCDNLKNLSRFEIINKLKAKGFAYILDFNKLEVDYAIDKYIFSNMSVIEKESISELYAA